MRYYNMKKKSNLIINSCLIISLCILIICLCIYLSNFVIVKKAIPSPSAAEPDMYVIYYDYYADCWGITDGINNNKANLLKITKGPDPKNELSSDIWSCNLFVVYGKIQLVEEDDFCNTYTIQCTHWDIITQNETGILRINTNCRPRKKEGLTIYDYKWFDFIAEPDGLYR